ncbi:hypothetical protein BGZ94_007289 [Podila epigama]|nr:hypothetical protein BGZ94_007289 [Podila epigama]
MSIIYTDMAVSVISLILVVFVVPESVPRCQSPRIKDLYRKALEAAGVPEDVMNNKRKEKHDHDGPWYTHILSSLRFFKPNGHNSNLILLAAMSFLSTLALKGTFSVLILYTNKVFLWTEYEDGIMFSSSSLVRLLSLIIILPVLSNMYNRHMDRRLAKMNYGKKSLRQQFHQSSPRHHEGVADADVTTFDNTGNPLLDPSDPTVAASVEHLGETLLHPSGDEGNKYERGLGEGQDIGRQDGHQDWRDSAYRTSSLATDRTKYPTYGTGKAPWGKDDASNINGKSDQQLKKDDDDVAANPAVDVSKSSTATNSADLTARSLERARDDMRFDTWIIRIGFTISSTTYVMYGLATESWMFYTASALHAVAIIGAPSQKSLLTALVKPSEFAAVLGAIQVVDSLSGIVSPVVISWVYALTVESHPAFVWYAIAGITGVCAVLAFMIRQSDFRNSIV